MFKNISIFALAFAFVGLTGCADETTTIETEETTEEVAPNPEVLEENIEAEANEAGEAIEGAAEEAAVETDAAMEDMEAELEGEQ
jgi:hypothetical protein